jgi:hypothetical protein
VIKTIELFNNPVADAITYSLKCTGRAEIRSSVTAESKVEQRFIAPPDFVARLAKQSEGKFHFGKTLISAIRENAGRESIISTVPMFILMDALGYEKKLPFNFKMGTVITCDLGPEFDICATVYIPDPETPVYRVSITESKLIIECSKSSLVKSDIESNIIRACISIGIAMFTDYVIGNAKAKIMQYSKISPIDDGERKRFIMWATERHKIYSLGRFATWRPGMLLDDLVKDVRVIQKMEKGNTQHIYDMKK